MKFEIIEPPPPPPPPKHYVLTLSADELEYIRRAIMSVSVDDEARERFLRHVGPAFMIDYYYDSLFK